ncbi:hypothetical protein G6514_005021 [Epicoccum nigrum]|nr:hypothetical protein G6514_005021 [Epicoccum nigrum]
MRTPDLNNVLEKILAIYITKFLYRRGRRDAFPRLYWADLRHVFEVTTKFMRDPVRIVIKEDELTLEGIKQFYIAGRPCLAVPPSRSTTSSSFGPKEPWVESWIRAPDVERKLSRFEMHKDSVELAAKLGVPTPRKAVQAAREALVNQQAQIRALGDKSLKEARIDRGPWDDIEIIQSQVLYLRQPSADWTAIRVQTESGMLDALARQNAWSCSMAPDISACKNVRFTEESIPGSLPQRPKNSNTYGNEATMMPKTFNVIKPPTIMVRQYDVADRDWTWATGEILRPKKTSHIGLSFGS